MPGTDYINRVKTKTISQLSSPKESKGRVLEEKKYTVRGAMSFASLLLIVPKYPHHTKQNSTPQRTYTPFGKINVSLKHHNHQQQRRQRKSIVDN